jgi:hypothetical protein
MTDEELRDAFQLDPEIVIAAMTNGFRLIYEICCRRIRFDIMFRLGQDQLFANQVARVAIEHWATSAGTAQTDEQLDAFLDRVCALAPPPVKEEGPTP